MRGIYHYVDEVPSTVDWRAEERRRAEQAVWAEVWQNLRLYANPMTWPKELARHWLGLTEEQVPPLPDNVEALLTAAAPYLSESPRH
jgi:hypothetical protein